MMIRNWFNKYGRSTTSSTKDENESQEANEEKLKLVLRRCRCTQLFLLHNPLHKTLPNPPKWG
jgi:hypothetical protein